MLRLDLSGILVYVFFEWRMMNKERFSSLLVKDFMPPAASLFSWTEAGHRPAPSLRLPFFRMATSV